MAIHSDAKPHSARNVSSGRLMRDLPLAARILIIIIAAIAGFMLASWIVYLQGPPPAPGGASGGVLLPHQGTYCGDNQCEPGETCKNCPTDCGKCSTCGDGVCDPSETCAGCTADCCPSNNCNEGCNNNGICEPPCEGSYNCGDCPSPCGDGICAAAEVDSCCGPGNDCTVAITCGDGICSACESNANCPTDCTGQPTEEPTTAVPTTVVPTTAVPAAATKVPTKAATSVPNTATATATATLTATATATGSATPTVTPTPEPEQSCGLVPYESRPDGWKAAYGEASNPSDYIPVQADDLEVWVCPVPPAGEQLCIPIYNNILEPVGSDLTKIHLVDCSDVGVCRTFDQVGQLNGDQLCFTIDATTNPTCVIGCALSPDQAGFQLPFPWWYLLLAALLLLLLLIILLLIRRRRDDDDDRGDTMEGVVTRQRPPTSPGPSPVPSHREAPPTILETPEDDPNTMRVPPVPPPTDQH